MKRLIKYSLLLVALVVVAGAIADSWAQCAPARIFRSSGKLGNNLDFDVVGTDNNGNQIGYFWDSDDANNSNSGFAPNYGARCPIDQWWKERVPPLRQIDGAQGGTGCAGAGMGCPANKLTIVVEDYAEGGPPGIDQTAYYAAFMVDETPVSGRWYDYGNLDMTEMNNAVIPMLPYPELVVTGSSYANNTIIINYNLPDQTDMVHSTDWAGGGGMFPTTDVIREWQLFQFVGPNEPGRARSDGWVAVQTIAYVPGGTSGTITAPYPDPSNTLYFAVGIGFNGGAYGVIDSALVGRATGIMPQILADPEWPVEFDHKPSAKQPVPQQIHSEGRR